MRDPAASAEGIGKHFGATVALDGVDFAVERGEIHALVGENGAGKSTLIRILAGALRPDRGVIRMDGIPTQFTSPRDALAAGVVMIPQELRLVPALSVGENIMLGALPERQAGPLALVDWKAMHDAARAVLAQLGHAIEPALPVGKLSFAERQLVAIARGLQRHGRVFILDEPTSALEHREAERLFSVLRRLRIQGTAIIYISHRLEEVVEIADRSTVLRDGRVAATVARENFSVPELAAAMTGQAEMPAVTRVKSLGDVVLEAETIRPSALHLRAGEVVGIAGLIGSGAGRILQSLFGLAEPTRVVVGGNRRHLRRPLDAVAVGIGMVPPERSLGLIMNQSVQDNILLPSLDRLRRRGFIDRAAGDRIVRELLELLDIRPRQPHLAAGALSGGNQQKVILAKWLARRVAVMLLEEPTHGIDIAAKAQIHALIGEFARRGGGVLVRSSELSELALLCDRVLAVRHGRVAAAFERAESFDEAKLSTAIGS